MTAPSNCFDPVSESLPIPKLNRMNGGRQLLPHIMNTESRWDNENTIRTRQCSGGHNSPLQGMMPTQRFRSGGWKHDCP
jgi:hypothetical protein